MGEGFNYLILSRYSANLVKDDRIIHHSSNLSELGLSS
jgi:hypothetical protein